MAKVMVPVKVLMSKQIRPVTKLLYALLWQEEQAEIDKLAKQLGMSERSVWRQLAILRKLGHLADGRPVPADYDRFIGLNLKFLQDNKWRVNERYLYIVMMVHSHSSWCFQTAYQLATQGGLRLKSTRQALGFLRRARIVESYSDGEHLIRDPVGDLSIQIKLDIAAYVDKGRPRPGVEDSKGERLMKACLDLMVANRFYSDNVPFLSGHLENPLELDRLYLSNPPVAFEFNGPHHYDEKAHSSRAEFKQQQNRDKLKREMCMQTGTELIVVTEEDLHPVRLAQLAAEKQLKLRPWKYVSIADFLQLVALTVEYLEVAKPEILVDGRLPGLDPRDYQTS